MNFTPVTLTVTAGDVVFSPYDRGARGAFVYRESNVLLNARRLVVSSETNDNASDRYTVQLNVPRVQPLVEGCCPTASNSLMGTDLVKTDVRFLANTSSVDRIAAIDLQIAALQEYKTMISVREKLYA